MSRSVCVTFRIDYLLSLPDAELEGTLVRKGNGGILSAAEIRAYLGELAANGYEGVPICDAADASGFCAGHDVPEPMCG